MVHTLITLTPLNKALFRWFGESAPGTRGPMTALNSELMPLPTTVAGAIYTAFGGRPHNGGVTVEALHSLLLSREVLGCDNAAIWGPYILVRDKAKSEWAACFHSIREGLLCITRDGRTLLVNARDITEFDVGISLRNDYKGVMTGYLFVRKSVNFVKLAEVVGESLLRKKAIASVAVEIGCDIDAEPERNIVPLGGEGYIAKVEITRDSTTPLEELTPSDCSSWCVAYFATPYLLTEKAKLFGEWPPPDPATEIKRISETLDIPGEYVDISKSRLIYGITPTGWDMAQNKPRPSLPALLPGSWIAFKAPKPPVARPQALGFGTLITLSLTKELTRTLIFER